MQEQVSFKFRALQLPLPCCQPAGNGNWRRECCPHKIIVCGLQHRWIASPDREQIKHHADDEERDRKMNDYRMLCVFCQESSFEIKRVHAVLSKALREFSSRQFRANRPSVPACLRSRSRTLRWPALTATGRRINPSFSDRATTM